MNHPGKKKADEIGNGKIVTEWTTQAIYAVMKGLTRQRVNTLRQTSRLETRYYYGRKQVRDMVEK